MEAVWKARGDIQKESMAYRSVQAGGNKFAKFASTAVFAPLIFVIPFPAMVSTPGQDNSQMINGGNYVKNILAFFVFFSLFWILKNRKWREYTLVGSFVIGYLAVIAMSSFAQAERFHQPAYPFLLIFAAFGISKITNMEKKYFSWYLAILFVALIAWNWIKLAGRGLV